MRIVVDLGTGGVTLAEAGSFERFAVQVMRSGAVEDAPAAVGDALRRAGVGRMDGSGDALVEPSAVRRLAADGGAADGGTTDGGATDGRGAWNERFAAMVAAAASHGWVGADGSIRAHLEWEV